MKKFLKDGISGIKKVVDEKGKALDATLTKYMETTEKQVRDFVDNNKMIKDFSEDLTTELNNMVNDVSTAIDDFAEKHNIPIPKLNNKKSSTKSTEETN